jgi:hypothetical protein
MEFDVEPLAGKRTAIIFRFWVWAAQAAKRTANKTLVFTVVTPQVPPKMGSARYYLNARGVRMRQFQVIT